MLSLLKFLSAEKNINAPLKSVTLIAFFCVFGLTAFGQCSVDVGPATTYGCVGGSVTLTATLTNPPASPTYSWTGPGGFTSNSASITISNLNVSNAGTYTVSVSGCTNSPITDNLTLVVLENFTITQNNITLCPGQNSINFNPTISGNNSVTPVYSWTGPNSFNSALANPVISSATSTNAGAYNVTATLGQCSVSDEANVLVLNNLNVSASSNGPLCVGQNLNLSSSVTGNSGQSVNYSWTGPNGYTSSLANPTISNVSSAQNGTYTVTVTSSGCSDNESLTPVILIPTISSNQLSSSTNYGGWLVRCTQPGANTGAISVSSNIPSSSNLIADTYTINWGDGSPNTVLTSDNWTNQAHTYPLGLYNLNLSIASTMGCTSSQNYSVFVGNQPASPGITLPENAQGCSPMTLTFPISGVSNNVPGTTYTISFSDGSPALTFNQSNIPNSITHTFTSSSCGSSFTNGSITESNAFGVSMQAVNPCGSASASAGPIRTSSPPSISFQLPEYICTNQTALADNTSSPGTNNTGSACNQNHSFYWNINGSTGWSIGSQNLGSDLGFPQEYDMWASGSDPLSITFNQAGTYTVQLTEKNSCSSLQSLTKTICVINPPTCSFSVSPTEGCTSLNVSTTNNSIAPLCPGTTIPLAYSWVVSTPTNPSFATSTSPQPNFNLPNTGVTALTYTITLTVTPLNPATNLPMSNCASTCIKTVLVYPQPTFSTQPQSPANVCLGGTFNAISVVVNYLGTGTPTYQWYSNTTASSTGGTLITGATSASYVPPATAVGTIHYYCVVTFPNNTNCNQIISNNVPAVVVPDPIATATPATQTICVGGTVPNPFTGTYTNGVGTPTYQWNTVSGGISTPINNATASTYTPPVFTTTGPPPFNYSVTINTSGSGCTASTSAQIAVVVVADPTITVPLATQTLCQNATPTALTVTASGGSGTLQYQWYSNTVNNTTNGTLITGATSNTYTPPTSAVGTLYYYCVVTTPVSGCSVTSAASTVIVNPAPTFNTQPTASNVCVGGTTNQMCVTYINGTGTPSYQWYSNAANNSTSGTAISGATASCYTPPSTTAGTTYYYAIISLTGGGCSVITSTAAAVVITPDPALTTQPTSTQTICVGGSSSALTVALQASTGIGPFTYQWFSNTTATNSNGTLISGATAATYTPAPFTTNGTFYYYCVVTAAGNGCGTVTSQVATVVVVVDPTVTAPIATQTLCQTAAPTPLTVTASGGTGAFLYQWYSNATNNNTSGTLIPGATASTYSPPTAAVGTMYYYCVVTTAVSGCSVSSETAAIVVNPAPNFTTQPVTSTVCVGGTTNQMCVTYANGTGNPAYQWYSNVSNNTTGGSSINGATSNCYTPPSTTAGTTYYYAIITLTGGGCANITSNTAAVIVAPDPVLATQPTSTQTICVGGSSSALTVALQANTGLGAFTYQWYSNTTATNSGGSQIAGANAATYNPSVFNTAGSYYFYCVVTDAGIGCGAVTSQVATVVVVADPTVTSPLATQTLCQTASPTPLTVTASGGTGTFLYQWYSNTANNNTSGTLISGATASTYSPPTATVGTMYYYCIVTTAASGCSVTSATAAIIVTQAPNFTTQPVTSTVCVAGTTNQMCVAYANGTGNPAYQWYSNVNNNTTGGSSISGATSNCYTPSSTTAGTTYYYAIITLTGGGCASITSSAAAVIVAPDPVLATQPTSTQTICVGGSSSALTVALQANTGLGAFTYQWYSNTTATNSGGSQIAGANAATYNPSVFNTAGSYYYYCVVTDAGIGCGAVTSQVATVVVVADPIISAQPLSTQTLCQTATPTVLSVTASGGTGTLLYQWYSNTANNTTSGTLIGSATSATYSPPTAAVGTVYYYCVITTAASGCSVTSATAAIIVTPAPTFTTQPSASNVCVGGTPTQMCVVYTNGTGTAAYQWYSNTTNSTTAGTQIPSANTSCYTPPSTTAGTTYYYAVITLTGGGCSSITSNTAAVVISPDPVIATQPTATQTFCVGGSSVPLTVTLQASTGIGAFTYQWFSNTTAANTGGTQIGSATAATYNPPVFNTAGNFYYYCVVTDAGNGCGTVASQVATVVVVADPTISAQPLTTQTLCQTAPAAPLTVTAAGGTGTLVYQWYSNTSNNTTSGTSISGANSATYTPSTATVGTVYYYCVITTAASGCSTTTTASAVIVNPAPTFTTQPAASNVCIGGSTNQMCVAYTNGTGTATYQWYSNATNSTIGGTPVLNATNNCYTPPSTTAGTTYYYAIISLAGGGCSSITSNTAEVIISTGTSLSTQPTPSQTICVGGTIPAPLSVSYAGGVGTPTYQWYSSPSNTAISGATSTSFTPPTFNSAGTNNYYVIVTLPGAGCGSQTSNTASVIVIPDPTATISANSSYCQNAGNVSPLAVVVTGGTGTPSYQWYSNTTNSNTGGTIISGANTISYSPPVANTGTTYYYCMITQSGTNCAVNSPAAQIIVTPAPTFTTQPTAAQTVCIGGATTQLNVAYSNGTGAATYQWYSNTANTYTGGIAISTATNTNFTPPSTAAGTTYYYCIISFAASGGCSMINSNIAEVVVVADPIISTQPLTTQTICVGGTIPTALNVAYTGGVGTPTYQWFAGTPTSSISGATASSYTPPVFTVPGTSNYYATISLSGSGCDVLTSTNGTVIVVADPTATISSGASYCQNAGSVVALSVVVSNGQGTPSYQWYSNTTNSNTGGTIISGANTISYSPPVATTGTTYYYCMITQSGANCAVNSPAAQIIVTPAPTFTTQPTATQSVCIGGITTPLNVAYSNGTGTATYQWYSSTTNAYANGVAISTATTANFTPPSNTAGTTFYYCVISFSANGGCSMINSNIAEVVVVADPIISTQPLTTQTICVGGTIPTALNVAYTGGVGTPTYQWFAGTPASSISGATASSYTPPVFTIAGTSNYYATISLSGSGCDVLTSTNGTVIVVADPTATISPGASYCQNAGSVVALSVVVSNGQGTTSYQWYSNNTSANTGGTIISGANAISYSPPVATTGTTYYYCMITQSGANCAVNSPTAQIIVTPAPTFTTQPTATQSVCIGGTTTPLSVAYSNGTGTASYQWYSNTTNTYAGGTQIAGQTLSSFTPSSTAAGTTFYYCVISFSADGGCSMINSNIAEVVVVADPIVSTQPLTTQTICVGGTIPTALNVAYTGGVGTPTYQWFAGTPTSSISGATASSYTPPVFTITGTSNYYATISLSGSGCDVLTSTNGTVIVVADPTATISPGASYCQNAGSVVALSVVVSNGQGTPSYQWYSNTTSANTGGTIISGANAISYSPPVAATGTTYYYCTITQSGTNCAVNSPTAQIIVTPAPTFTTQPTATQSVCIGGATAPLNVAYNNGTGTATYQWYSNTTNTYAGGTQIAGQTLPTFTPPSTASSTTYYYCVISFSADGGCSMISSDIATVIVVPDPTISTQPLTTQTICVGGTIPVAIDVTYSGGLGNPTYQWFGGTPATSLTGATNSSFTPPAFTTPGTYNYYATVSLSGIGCDVLTTANASIVVVADPVVSAQPTPTQSVCQNTPTAQISVSVTGGNGSATYQWFSNTTNSNTGGTILVGETLNTFTPPSSVVGTQYYYCVINQTGANCGVTSNPAAVVVNLAPVISTQPLSAQQHCLNATTNNLQVAYVNGTGLPSYQWFVNTTNSTVGGTPINTATSNVYSPPSNIGGTYYYYCVISFVSGGGCPSIISNVSEVIVHPYPIVTITGGETICLLESSAINFAFTPSSGLYDITYTANGQSVTLENYNGANPLYTVTPTQTTTYVVTNIAYDQVPQCAIQPNTSIVVVVNPLPALNNSNYTFCSDVAGTSLQYTPDANTYTYDWLPNPSANYLGQNNGPSIINVTLPDPVGNAPTNFYYVTNLTNNATGCNALDSILVTINPNPVGTFTLPTIGCINSPIPLSNGDATIGSYEWSIDGSLYSLLANPDPPVFTTLGDHTIEMVAINQYGCTDTLNSVIQIYDQPVANFTTDTDYGCAPLDVNFTNLSTGQYITSYDWTFAPDTVSWNYQYTSSNFVDPPSVTYLQGDVTTIYTATLAVTNACGTVTSQQEITVLPIPVAEFTLATNIICSGSSLVLNNISVGEPLTYFWSYGNTISYNPNLLSMYFPSDSVTNVYPLTLTLTNACGTDTYVDSVTVLPDLVNGGFVTTADAGCSPLTVTLTNTTFNTNLSATWNLDDPLNTIVANQNSIQFTYYATNNITQTYNPFLVVTDGCASDTIVANLSVFANPLPIISASQTNLCAGTTVDFSGTITGGDTGFGYDWDFGGLGTSISSTPSFTFPSGSSQGLAIPVTLTATSPTYFGTNCSNTTTTVIYVYNNPDTSQISFNTTEGCSDLGVTISNLPSASNQINWGDGTVDFNNSHTYINNGATLISNPVEINSTITYGTIPALSCTTFSNQIVNVYPIPLPQIFASGFNVCDDENIDLIASTSNNQNIGITYLWDFGTLGTSTNVNTSISYNNGTSIGNQNTVSLTAFQNTSGTVCSATVLENIVVYETPDLSSAIFNNQEGCSPLLTSIDNLPVSTYTFNWGDGVTTSAPNHLYINQSSAPLNYNVTINGSNFYPTIPLLTCSSVANQIVEVNPQPIAAFTFDQPDACFYPPVIATMQNTSLFGVAPYTWNINGTSNSNSLATYQTSFNTPGIHPIELVVTNQFGCTDSVTNSFIIHELPTAQLNIPNNQLCLGTTAEFAVTGTNISISTWDFGDGTVLNLLNPSTLSHYYNQPGVYSIEATLTSNLGCVNTLTFQNYLIVHPSPTASFLTNTLSADIVFPYFEFYNYSQGGTNYSWDFGDSNFSTDTNPTHTYQNIGNYLVQLTVSNEYNCIDIATEIINVEGIVMFVPSAFTPLDYNGVNDVFKPSFSSTEGIEFYEFSIYNRWGVKIFQTNDVDEAWIGNSQEHPPGDDNYYAQNDVYTYQVVYRKKSRADDPQPDKIVTGHVTIIR